MGRLVSVSSEQSGFNDFGTQSSLIPLGKNVFGCVCVCVRQHACMFIVVSATGHWLDPTSSCPVGIGLDLTALPPDGVRINHRFKDSDYQFPGTFPSI